MKEILHHLELSIQDEIFSKAERKSLKALLVAKPLDNNQLNFIKSKVFELASQRITPGNQKFIIEWIKGVQSVLTDLPPESTDVFFSPGDSCRNVIIQQLGAAVKQVNICVFTISHDQITNAILTGHKRGLNIRIITDNDKSFDQGSDIDRIASEGVSVKVDTTPNHMHHKFMVVDDRSLITGSYNWTRSAARFNHENIVLIKEAGVVRSFLKEFGLLWKEMSEYKK